MVSPVDELIVPLNGKDLNRGEALDLRTTPLTGWAPEKVP